MILTPLQPQYKTRINVRPVKHAYFVRDNDKDALVRVMEYTCTQWGGIRNLIVPVRADLTIVQQFEYFLRHHEPDVFVTFLKESEGDDEEQREALQSYLGGLLPQRIVEVEVGDEFVDQDRSMHALGVVPPEQLKSAELTSHNFFGPGEDR